jgi:hypothetical protein
VIFLIYIIIINQDNNREKNNMSKKTKQNYEPPFLEVTQVQTEGNIAESGRYSIELEDWDKTDNTYAPYDGDIWLDL